MRRRVARTISRGASYGVRADCKDASRRARAIDRDIAVETVSCARVIPRSRRAVCTGCFQSLIRRRIIRCSDKVC